MYINTEKCITCKRCIPFCPVNAIELLGDQVTIDLDKCVECGTCERDAKCPVDAIYNVHLDAPRAYRKAFSDPFGKHENTSLGHLGRGTEEVKTNDVTGIVSDLDVVAMAIELGRPSVSASFRDIEKITMCVAPYVRAFEVNNPITSLIIDKDSGQMEPSVLNERVLSAIVEFTCDLDKVEIVLQRLQEISTTLDTVFSLGLIAKVDEDKDVLPVYQIIKDLGIDINEASSKTNMGLGRPRFEK